MRGEAESLILIFEESLRQTGWLGKLPITRRYDTRYQSASESKEYLLQGGGGHEKEPISSDADADGVISNTDKDDEAEVIGCPEADKNDDNNDRGRGFSSSNCDCDGDGSVRANCKFSLRECDFPDMTEDVTSAMSSDLQNLKRRLRQEQERNHQGQG